MACEVNMERIIGLEGLWLRPEDRTTVMPLVLVEVRGDGWVCLTQGTYEGRGTVGFIAEGNSWQVAAAVEADRSRGRAVRLHFLEALPEQVDRMVNDWLQLKGRSERRRGSRYAVGLRDGRWSLFGLRSQRQLLVLGKGVIDVVISDVSSHGALVTGEVVHSLVSGQEIVRLQASFVNPVEPLVLPALVVRSERPIPKLAQYALKFIDPVSVAWMRRVDEYAKNF
ncbi:MAG: hypothetical protein IJW57_12110 [Spirochaetaceae bacterium]|nr:hypothetical protein [Spirochaetaceae bacterium]MBQ8561479.1 hypothetical protein [Spirochaetaceae bacterium]